MVEYVKWASEGTALICFYCFSFIMLQTEWKVTSAFQVLLLIHLQSHKSKWYFLGTEEVRRIEKTRYFSDYSSSLCGRNSEKNTSHKDHFYKNQLPTWSLNPETTFLLLSFAKSLAVLLASIIPSSILRSGISPAEGMEVWNGPRQ